MSDKLIDKNLSPGATLESPPIIYLIDDDEEQAQSLSIALEKKGFQLRVFNSLEELRQVWPPIDERPSVVVLDMVFPEGMDAGLDIISEFGFGQDAGIPVVMVSVREDLAGRLAALRAGVSRYLTKPIDPERLAHILNGMTGRIPPEPYRVLLIDDELFVLEAYSLILRQAGMVVLPVSQALVVLESIHAFKPDVVILDMYMPDATGPELAAVLREQDAYAQIPILFLSAEADPDKQLLALNLGGDDFLLKPITPAHLVAAVTARARRIRQSRELTLRLQVALYEREREHMALDAHALVSVADHSGMITYANDNFCAASGYTREELLGKDHRLLKSDIHDAAFYRDMWDTIINGKIWRGEICNRRRDGGLYWVSSTITPFLDQTGKIYQYVSIRNDITQIKQAAAELELLGKRLNLATEAAGVGIFDLNILNGILSWDARMLALYGQTQEGFSGKLDAWYKALHPEDLEMVSQALQDALNDKKIFARQFRVIWPDGSVHWIEAKAAVTCDENGRAVRMIGTNWDVSKSKEIESQLLEAKIQAEAANQAKSNFLSNMSHELRTPMNAILGFGQMLECDPRLNEIQLDSTKEILKAGNHLLELINQVLDLAKIEAGQVDMSMELIDLNQVVLDCVQLTQPLVQARKLFLHSECALAAVVKVDRTRLKQVLLNLLSNAIKYSYEGGRIDFTVQADESKTRWQIAVRDRGIGIAPERMKDLFQPFNRLHAFDSSIEGTGIGLLITKQLVELMHGEIDVISHEEGGTTFCVSLDAAIIDNVNQENDVDELQINNNSSNSSNSSEFLVLCIDDNPANLKLMGYMLSRRPNFKLIMETNPEIGLAQVFALRPDLILLDINMPGMNGYEILEKIKGDRELKSTPVVAITANAMPQDVSNGRAAGFAEYLAKPLDLNIFLKTVDQCLMSEEIEIGAENEKHID